MNEEKKELFAKTILAKHQLENNCFLTSNEIHTALNAMEEYRSLPSKEASEERVRMLEMELFDAHSAVGKLEQDLKEASDAVDFAEWIGRNCVIHPMTCKLYLNSDFDKGDEWKEITTTELYKLFKDGK